MSMEQISKWRTNKNLISKHKIQIGLLKEQIGEYKEKISICEDNNRETPYYWVNQWVNNNIPEYHNSIEDSLSQGQYESKLWLQAELKKHKAMLDEPLHIDIVGSWFGFPLIELLSHIVNIKQIDLYDIDENCHKVVAQYINHFDYDFKIVQFGDFFERTDLRRRHLVINTSSEHMPDIVKMKQYYKDYPTTPLLILQSNDYKEISDHINCVSDETELIAKNHIRQVYYKGMQSLPLYNRYMVIGRW